MLLVVPANVDRIFIYAEIGDLDHALDLTDDIPTSKSQDGTFATLEQV